MDGGDGLPQVGLILPRAVSGPGREAVLRIKLIGGIGVGLRVHQVQTGKLRVLPEVDLPEAVGALPLWRSFLRFGVVRVFVAGGIRLGERDGDGRG